MRPIMAVTSPHKRRVETIKDNMNEMIATPEGWLKKKKWTKFLKSLPLNRPKTYYFEEAKQLNVIKVIAAVQNAKDPKRKYSVTALDYENKSATITANNK